MGDKWIELVNCIQDSVKGLFVPPALAVAVVTMGVVYFSPRKPDWGFDWFLVLSAVCAAIWMVVFVVLSLAATFHRVEKAGFSAATASIIAATWGLSYVALCIAAIVATIATSKILQLASAS